MKKFDFLSSNTPMIFRMLKRAGIGDLIFCPKSKLSLLYRGNDFLFNFGKSILKENYKKLILKKVYDACQKIGVDLQFQAISAKDDKIIVEEFKVDVS